MVIGAGLGQPAFAQTADEYVLILLDHSTSMGDLAVTGAPTPTFWDNAIAAAQNWVHHDKLTKQGDARPSRAYAVWTFFDDTCSRCPSKVCGCPNTQKNVRQIWPQRPSDCAAGSGGSFESTTNMCVIAGNEAGDKVYDLLKNKVLASLGKQRPGTHSNTPLAESLCLAVEKLYAAARHKPKLLVLETDGGDSSSVSACSGYGSVPLPGDTFQKKESWGLTKGSWQETFLRRIVRMARFPPRPDDPRANAAQEKAAVAFGRGILLPGEKLPSTLRLRADLHYAICDPANPTSAPCGDTDRLADSPARELAAKTGPKIPSIHAGEISFFKALAQGLTDSTVREFVRVPAAALGRKHKIAGDVDDSGCVDDTDLYLLTSKELWFGRALPTAEDAVRADLNRDGWVNQKDAAILLSTWGKRCRKGAVAKKPPLPE
ncbi:MAG: hypothetical protein JXP73_14655 [Deltaproteobacteria bacterium]|nr:hypothetical protein [Deltaproteobacteria bacterium]